MRRRPHSRDCCGILPFRVHVVDAWILMPGTRLGRGCKNRGLACHAAVNRPGLAEHPHATAVVAGGGEGGGISRWYLVNSFEEGPAHRHHTPHCHPACARMAKFAGHEKQAARGVTTCGRRRARCQLAHPPSHHGVSPSSPRRSPCCALSDPASVQRGPIPARAVTTAMQAAARPCGAAVPSSGATIAVRHERRGRLVVQAVAASQPATRLTKDDLVAYLASGCKPRDQWRCALRGMGLAAGGGSRLACRQLPASRVGGCDLQGEVPACLLPAHPGMDMPQPGMFPSFLLLEILSLARVSLPPQQACNRSFPACCQLAGENGWARCSALTASARSTWRCCLDSIPLGGRTASPRCEHGLSGPDASHPLQDWHRAREAGVQYGRHAAPEL